MDRIILHCDCNCFYASCELLSHPDLRQLPVAVCGDPTERHGIILAKNEPAKRCGVKTAETIWKAKQKCPGLILLPPHHRLYAEYSKKINAVYGEYTDLVEPFGIDESWLDVTNSLHLFGGDARALADTLRGRIKREFGFFSFGSLIVSVCFLFFLNMMKSSLSIVLLVLHRLSAVASNYYLGLHILSDFLRGTSASAKQEYRRVLHNFQRYR